MAKDSHLQKKGNKETDKNPNRWKKEHEEGEKEDGMAERKGKDLEHRTKKGEGIGIRQPQRKEEERHNDKEWKERPVPVVGLWKEADEKQKRKGIVEGCLEDVIWLHDKHQDGDKGKDVQGFQPFWTPPIYRKEEAQKEDAADGKAKGGKDKEGKKDEKVDDIADFSMLLSKKAMDDRQKEGKMETAKGQRGDKA